MYVSQLHGMNFCLSGIRHENIVYSIVATKIILLIEVVSAPVIDLSHYFQTREGTGELH